ncbi:unnamed protein product [Macrosiphum euphorbiae]|uniref:DUF4371 domain-containing protein n=1 Tax=Macrosiphum euphorbiae TaxID=13131 RepID=A0AAV0XVC7_9HEMI|nr:unnamed protein product [Macrosiphum euphorbiae]
MQLHGNPVFSHNRSILGINIQYIKNGEINLKTLAMVELFDKHTAVNLKTSLLDVLVKYEITREQIYTITCDNAANMIRMARIIKLLSMILEMILSIHVNM